MLQVTCTYSLQLKGGNSNCTRGQMPPVPPPLNETLVTVLISIINLSVGEGYGGIPVCVCLSAHFSDIFKNVNGFCVFIFKCKLYR